MEPVGKLYKQGSDIELHGIEHLAEVVDLKRVDILLFFMFGDNIHQKSHVVAKLASDIVDGVIGIFDHIVQKRRYNHM